MGITVTPKLSDPFWHQDHYKTLLDEVKHGAQDLIDLIAPLVMDRVSHVETGALMNGIMGTPNTDPSDPEIAIVFPSEQAQLDAHGRLYAQYIEGGPLGDSSWTITDPDEMFNKSAEEDIDTVVLWAEDVGESFTARIAAGGGIVP